MRKTSKRPLLAAPTTLLSLALASCGERPPVFVGWPEPLPDVYFVLHATDTRLLETRGPFDGATAPPRLELTVVEGARWIILGFETAALRAAVPQLPLEFDPLSARLESGTEDCAGGRFIHDGDRHLRRVAASGLGAKTWALDPEAALLDPLPPQPPPIPTLALVLPEDPELCLAELSGSKYRPFGRTEALLADRSELGGRPIPTRTAPFDASFDLDFYGVAWLDEESTVAFSRNALLRIRRGEDASDDAANYRALAQELDDTFPGARHFIEAIAVDPRTVGAARQRILAALTAPADWSEPGALSRLVELWLDDTGFSAPRVLASPQNRMRSVLIEPSGRAIAVGFAGLVVVAEPDAEPPARELRLSAAQPYITEIQRTLDPARPHLVALEAGAFSLGDVVTGELESIFPSGVLGSAVSGYAHHITPTEGSLLSTRYVGGLIAWERDHGWSSPRLTLPSSLSACATQVDACGRQQPSGVSIGSVARSASSFILPTTECDAIFLLDLKASCARVALPEASERASPMPSFHFRGIALHQDRLLASGSAGRLVELELR